MTHIPSSVFGAIDGQGMGIGIENLTIGDSVLSIDSFAFAYCNITELVIGNGPMNIGLGAFGYNKITSVYIPSLVQSVDPSAFILQ